MKAQWQQEKEMLGGVGKIKQEIEQARIEAEQATRAGDLTKAAEITYGANSAARASHARDGAEAGEHRRPSAVPEGGSRRRRHRRGRGAVDRHSRVRECSRASASG